MKDDGSTETELFEVKDANKSHTIKSSDLQKVFRRAVQQGKEPQYIVYFGADDLTLTGVITKGKR